jgi:hypothetical protein
MADSIPFAQANGRFADNLRRFTQARGSGAFARRFSLIATIAFARPKRRRSTPRN